MQVLLSNLSLAVWSRFTDIFPSLATEKWSPVSFKPTGGQISEQFDDIRSSLSEKTRTSNSFTPRKTFKVADEADNYRLTLREYNGTAGDSFMGHR